MIHGIDYERLFQDHRRHLWDLSYRITGSAAEADDVVQETFARALQSPPANLEDPWRPWLARVATNLAIDHLRRRQRQEYLGPWLPQPIELEPQESNSETRYHLMESATMAFLIALEALTPRQRAVLVLRDVFDCSVQETGAALGLTEANVKVTLHRAREAMKSYDARRCLPSGGLQARNQKALFHFLQAVRARDVGAIESLLSPDATSLTDGNGEFKYAVTAPVVGRRAVARLYAALAGVDRGIASSQVRLVNGVPAVLTVFSSGREGDAPRMLFRCDVGDDGLIYALHFVCAAAKLSRLRF